MSVFETAVLGEKVSVVERHLQRVAATLPARPEELLPSTGATDTVVLHLWQAIQVVLDLGISACFRLKLGAPAGYADAFVRLAARGHIDAALATRLAQAAGLRNRIAHAYEELDLGMVHEAATAGPRDLRAFLRALADL